MWSSSPTLRVSVPLKSMCSMKWVMPRSTSRSHTEPALTQALIATTGALRTDFTSRVKPLGSTFLTTSRPKVLGASGSDGARTVFLTGMTMDPRGAKEKVRHGMPDGPAGQGGALRPSAAQGMLLWFLTTHDPDLFSVGGTPCAFPGLSRVP